MKTYWPVLGLTLTHTTLARCAFQSIKVDTVHFNGTKFSQVAEFDDAHIFGAAFCDVVFERGASFTGAKLLKGIFSGARFEGPADFSRAIFGRDADFKDCYFAEQPNFEGARLQIRDHATVNLPAGWTLSDVGSPDAVPDGESGQWGKITQQ